MTRLSIDIPIPEGAKTCEGCVHCFSAFDACQLFRDGKLYTKLERATYGYKRLPECLAAERVKVGECWRIYDADGDPWEDCVSPQAAQIEVDEAGMRGGSKIVHVTRYRRRAK